MILQNMHSFDPHFLESSCPSTFPLFRQCSSSDDASEAMSPYTKIDQLQPHTRFFPTQIILSTPSYLALHAQILCSNSGKSHKTHRNGAENNKGKDTTPKGVPSIKRLVLVCTRGHCTFRNLKSGLKIAASAPWARSAASGLPPPPRPPRQSSGRTTLGGWPWPWQSPRSPPPSAAEGWRRRRRPTSPPQAPTEKRYNMCKKN